MGRGSKLETLLLPLGELRPHRRNPRRGDVAAIKESLELNGQYRPIVVNRRSMEILAGNHTVLAARELGWEDIAATLVDVDEERARRILLVDNRTNDLAGYDTAELVALLQELDDLEGTGYDDEALGALLDELAPSPFAENEPPPLPEEAQTRPGDLLQLGQHRLLCADARDPDSYRGLLGDECPELLWTDPPYGISYEGKTEDRLRIEGDTASCLETLLRDSFAAVDAVLSPGARLYVSHPAGELSLVFGSAFISQGWRLRQTLGSGRRSSPASGPAEPLA